MARYLIRCRGRKNKSESKVISVIRALSLCVIMLGVVVACTSQAATHTYELRSAGEDPPTVARKGPIDLAGFLAALRTFPWAEQVAQSQEGAEPSLKAIEVRGDGHTFFVSVVGDSEQWSYVVGVIYPQEVPVESNAAAPDAAPDVTVLRWAEAVVVKPVELVELYATRFFSGELAPLLDAMRKAPLFLNAPASELAHIGEG